MDTQSRKIAGRRFLPFGGFTSKLIKIIAILSLVLSNETKAQTDIDVTKYQNSFAFDPVILIDKQGALTRGFFLDIEGDSLRLMIDSRVEMIALSSIKYLKINSKKTIRNNMINLAFAGAFGAQLLLNKREWQSDRYIQSDGVWPHVLVSVLGAIGGGLVGFGLDLASDKDGMEYDLENPKDVQELNRELRQTTPRSKINFYYEIAKVYTRTDPATNESPGSYYSYEKITLNVFRSIRLTYDINERLEAGLAMYSVAEPNLKVYSYINNISGNEEMANRVYGYYTTAFYRLLGESKERSSCLKTGLGVGIANIDYTISRSKSVYDPIKYTTTITTESFNLYKTLFSVFAAIDARFYPTSGVSIALTGDYVFIPEKTLQSNLKGEGDRSFGNFSLGLSLGLHF